MYSTSARLFSAPLKAFLQEQISLAETRLLHAAPEDLLPEAVDAAIAGKSLTLPTIDRSGVSFTVHEPSGEQSRVSVVVPVAGSEQLLTKFPLIDGTPYSGELGGYQVQLTDHLSWDRENSASSATPGFTFQLWVGRDATPESVKDRARKVLDEVDSVVECMRGPVSDFNEQLELAIRSRAEGRAAAHRTTETLEGGLSGGL